MSLWRHRAQIERAVAGQLDPADEQKLRAHLATCADCRRHYDALSVQARILAGDPHESQSGNARELARLLGALNPAPKPAPSPLRWLVPAGVLALAALAVVFVPRGGEEVTFRGAPDAKQLSIFVVTAPKDGGELKRDISFPGPTGHVRADEWVAVAVNQNPDAALTHFRGVLVSEKADVLVLASGKSVALDPGKWRVFGVALPSAVDDAALAKAARAAGFSATTLTLPAAGLQASGVITVLP